MSTSGQQAKNEDNIRDRHTIAGRIFRTGSQAASEQRLLEAYEWNYETDGSSDHKTIRIAGESGDSGKASSPSRF